MLWAIRCMVRCMVCMASIMHGGTILAHPRTSFHTLAPLTYLSCITAMHHYHASLPCITATRHCHASLPCVTAMRHCHCHASLPRVTAMHHCHERTKRTEQLLLLSLSLLLLLLLQLLLLLLLQNGHCHASLPCTTAHPCTFSHTFAHSLSILLLIIIYYYYLLLLSSYGVWCMCTSLPCVTAMYKSLAEACAEREMKRNV